jgi:nickel-dependent lactate racemase
MRVELAYGRHGLPVELPDQATVIEPRFLPGLPDEAEALRRGLRAPINSPPLAGLIGPNDSVGISVCDLTRPMPSRRVLPVLLAELEHVPDDQITIFVATGTHRGNTRDELAAMLGPVIVGRYRVVNHDAFDLGSHELIGQTATGGPIWIQRAFLECSKKILTGFVEPHFFAGFSGGPKMVAPGLAALESVLHLHSAAFIGHPNATWGITVGNPIHDEVREISALVRPDFSLDVTINKEHAITNVFAGELFEAHRRACAFVRETAMQPVERPFDVVLTTNSGFPLDQNLYQTVKGMSAAAQIVKTGGAIVAAAACADGLPEHGSYKDILRMADSAEALLVLIESPGFSEHDQWQVQIQAQVQRKARAYLYTDGLTDEQVRAAHLMPCGDVERQVRELLAEAGPGATLAVLPQGPQTIPYVAPPGVAPRTARSRSRARQGARVAVVGGSD